MRTSLLLTLPLVAVLAACGSSDEGSSADAIGIEAGDTTCKVATTELASGKHTFEVKNTGKDVTEVYVYGKDGDDFNKVIGEVENIAPETSRDFPVTLGGGEYEVACKPGQKGDGIRTKLTVSGDEAGADEAYDREVEVEATDFAFKGLDGFNAKVGEKIEFKLANKSATNEHELEIFGPDGKELGEIGATKPGADGEVILELATAGTYTYKSGIGDDEAKGMKGTFAVS
jgi:uncharacterized cupredoxin-like copper-binding protein